MQEASKDDAGSSISNTVPKNIDEEKKISPQNAEKTCNCGGMEMISATFVYAIGNIKPRFPNLSIEKEYVQMMGRSTDISGLTDPQTFKSVLSKPGNRYLARQICWVFSIEGLDTYIIKIVDPVDLDLLINSLRQNPSPMDLDIIIGRKGPLATRETCNALMVPIVLVDQIYSFDRDTLLKGIEKPKDTEEKQFIASADDLFAKVLNMTDNVGSTDRDRAINYLATRYSEIYNKTSAMNGQNYSLTSIDVLPSNLTSSHKVVDVIFSYTNRKTTLVEKWFARVDITEEFPFLVTALSPYYSH